MPRTNRSGELFAQISRVNLIRDKTAAFGSTTLTGAHAVGATPLVVAGIANFADADLIRIGLENEYEVAVINGAPAGVNIVPRYAPAYAHADGDPVVEVELIKLGEVTDEGVDFGGMEGDFNAIMAASRRQVFSYLPGHSAPIFNFQLHNFNLENLAASFGMNETTRIQTAAARSRLVLDPEKFGEIGPNIGFEFLGVRKDGKNVSVQAWGVEIDPTAAGKFRMARGEGAPLPFSIRPTSGVQVEIW